MKIINDTVYSKGNPTINFGYYDPRTKAPYTSVLNASQYLISHLSSISIGFTICVNEDNKPVEYWWDGTAFVLKVNGITSELLLEAINNIPQQEITFPTIVFQTAYISVNKNITPQTPVGGDLTTPPSGWFYEVPQYQSGKKIYYSIRNYNSSITGGGTWDTPVELVSLESILETIPITKTYPFTLYIATNNPVPPAEEVVPNAPTHTITLNNNNLYVLLEVSATDVNWSEDYPSDTVDKTVWKSTNNFNVETNYAGLISITNTGWTTPRKYVDIDGILDLVTQDALNYLIGQLASIRNDINGLQGISGSLSSRLSAIETSAATGELPIADAQVLVNALRGEINQYAYKVRRRYSINNIYIATLTSEHKLLYDLDNLSVVAIYDKTTSEYLALFGTNGSDKAVIDDGVVYTVDNTDFIIDITNPTFTFTNAADTDTTSVSRIITLALYDSSLNQIEHELYATVLDSRWGNDIVIYCQYDENPQVLGVNYAQQLVDATTGAITNLVSSNSTNGLKSALQRIMADKIETDVWGYFENGNTGLTQGCIKATTITLTPEQLVLRAVTGNPNADPANKDIQSSIVDLIAGKLTLSASSNGNGVVLTLDGVNGNTYLHTHQFDINGEVIAKAIAAKELNINNLTYLNKDGSLEIASGLKGNSYFKIDGNGYIAGGLISWGNLGVVYRLYTNSAKTEEYRLTIVKVDLHLRVYDTNQSKYINVIVKGASVSSRWIYVHLNENNTTNYYIVYNTSELRLELSSTNVESNLYIVSQSYSGQELRVKGIITADGGSIGGWTIGADKLYNSNLIISPDSIYSSATSNTNNWAINKSGSAQFCKGKVSFAADGSGFIGNNSNNNPTISWTTNGTVSIPVELITGTIVANQVLISKGNTNDYAGISGVDVTSDDSKVIWSGGARTGNPTFYVTRDGRIFGKEGTLSVINNNHITDLSNVTYSDAVAAGYFENVGSGKYALNPAKVGDVVYLPSNDLNTTINIILPGAYNGENPETHVVETRGSLQTLVYYSDNKYYTSSASGRTLTYITTKELLDDLRSAVGRTIILVGNTTSLVSFSGPCLYKENIDTHKFIAKYSGDILVMYDGKFEEVSLNGTTVSRSVSPVTVMKPIYSSNSNEAYDLQCPAYLWEDGSNNWQLTVYVDSSYKICSYNTTTDRIYNSANTISSSNISNNFLGNSSMQVTYDDTVETLTGISQNYPIFDPETYSNYKLATQLAKISSLSYSYGSGLVVSVKIGLGTLQDSTNPANVGEYIYSVCHTSNLSFRLKSAVYNESGYYTIPSS